ncbi:MAG: malonyl-ACP O-methyltransferase BioC [Gammaproteobacteria bacterium]
MDKALVRRKLERAAVTYDDAAALQREINARMLARLDYIKLAPSTIVDLGAGTGLASRSLRKRYRGSQLLMLDFSAPMLRQAQNKFGRFRRPWALAGDAECVPLRDGCADLIYSNMMLEWCTDLDQTLRELRRVLQPDGLLLFSTLGPDTLRELRASWARVDDRPHVHAFIDMHDIGDALLRAGFADPVMDMEMITMTYSDIRQLAGDLRSLGMSNALYARGRGLMGKRCWQRMVDAYETWRGADGLLPASFEVVYGHAWAAERVAHGDSTEARIAIDQIGRAGKRKS